MSSPSGPGPAGPPQQKSPPYAPRYIGLGGMPSKIPDIPITSVFLFLYLIFAVIHINIMKYNKQRGHKFVFNGALFGFCQVRTITMSLRIAWACYPRNISLGIAAQVFVYVGTIILYFCNWFFTQRVVRAQHPRFGWSTPYRIIHRAGIVALILALFIVIVAAIQPFFTLDRNTLRIDRDLQLAGLTYFAVFTIAPMVLLGISFVLPRKGTEKFGAGRLRNAIAVLIIATVILAIGQVFRTVTTWLPEIPLRNARGQFNPVPWYFSKTSFYCFNFVTEILVVIFFAVMRVDLRFYVPDGAKKPGDYKAWRESQYNINVLGSEGRLKRASGGTGSTRSVGSNETMHTYENSVFEDTNTLADSLRFGSSIMEINGKTGHWKVKRHSANVSAGGSMPPSIRSSSSLWDPNRATLTDPNVPPVPSLPQAQAQAQAQAQGWPLGESQMYKLKNGRKSTSPHGSSRLREMHTPDMEMGDPINAAFDKLEGRSAPPPEYDFIAPIPPKSSYRSSSGVPKKQAHAAATSASDMPRKQDYQDDHSQTSPASDSTFTTADSELPAEESYSQRAAKRPRRFSSARSNDKDTSINTEAAEKEFERFSYEASPRNDSFEREKNQRRF